jgi:Na+-transporting methylmalonyl-CoA/oxaloacetate decarboxylase gamma subunit
MDMKLGWGEVWTVVLSGILIVFAVLVILITVVWIYGKIFTAINNRKSRKGDGSAEGGNSSAVTSGSTNNGNSNANAIAASETGNVVSQAQTGIPGSVIAAISAAVAAFTGGKGVVTGITRKKATSNTRRRATEWGRAGTVAAMRTLNKIGR